MGKLKKLKDNNNDNDSGNDNAMPSDALMARIIRQGSEQRKLAKKKRPKLFTEGLHTNAESLEYLESEASRAPSGKIKEPTPHAAASTPARLFKESFLGALLTDANSLEYLNSKESDTSEFVI